MKKFAFVLMIIMFAILINSATFAATPTPSQTPQEPTSSPTAEIDRIERIKEMVASRVAELKLVEKRGILGIVSNTSNTQITLEDKEGVKRIIDIDELTKFNDSSKKDFGISDISKGDQIACVGLYNKDVKRLLARFITPVKSIPIQYDAVVKDTDKADFILSVSTQKGEVIQVEVETTTKTQSYVKGDSLKKSGFSKIEVGQRVLITGFLDLEDKNKLIATRVLHFIDIPPSK